MIGPHLLRQQRRRQIFVDHRFAARQPMLAGDHRDTAAAVADHDVPLRQQQRDRLDVENLCGAGEGTTRRM